MKKCPWYKFHDWIYYGEETITYPKRGPFDPRDEEARTHTIDVQICAQCGVKTELVFDFNY